MKFILILLLVSFVAQTVPARIQESSQKIFNDYSQSMPNNSPSSPIQIQHQSLEADEKMIDQLRMAQNRLNNKNSKFYQLALENQPKIPELDFLKTIENGVKYPNIKYNVQKGYLQNQIEKEQKPVTFNKIDAAQALYQAMYDPETVAKVFNNINQVNPYLLQSKSPMTFLQADKFPKNKLGQNINGSSLKALNESEQKFLDSQKNAPVYIPVPVYTYYQIPILNHYDVKQVNRLVEYKKQQIPVEERIEREVPVKLQVEQKEIVAQAVPYGEKYEVPVPVLVPDESAVKNSKNDTIVEVTQLNTAQKLELSGTQLSQEISQKVFKTQDEIDQTLDIYQVPKFLSKF